MSKKAIESVLKQMWSDPMRIWKLRDLINILPYPAGTISSAVNAESKKPVSSIGRVGPGRYRLKLERLMIPTVESDPVFTWEVQYVYGGHTNRNDGKIIVEARTVVEASIRAYHLISSGYYTEAHITSVEQVD